MNINVTSYDANITELEDNQIKIYRMTANDPNGIYMFKEIEVGNKLHGFCTDKTSGSPSYAVYQVVSIEGFTNTKIKNIVLKRLNPKESDDNIPTLPAFFCSCDNYIDDIPSGDAFGYSNILTENARTFNLQHQPKSYIQIINLNDVITNENPENPTEKYYVQLTHQPLEDCEVTVTINGIVWYENEDMIVDRINKKLYLDTDDKDGFSFEDLTSSTDKIRVQYRYID